MAWILYRRGEKKGRVVRQPRPLCYACEGGRMGNLCGRCLEEAKRRFAAFEEEGKRAKREGRAC